METEPGVDNRGPPQLKRKAADTTSGFEIRSDSDSVTPTPTTESPPVRAALDQSQKRPRMDAPDTMLQDRTSATSAKHAYQQRVGPKLPSIAALVNLPPPSADSPIVGDADRQATYAFVQKFYAAIASLDPHAYGSFFELDAKLQFGNEQPLVGRSNLVAAARAQFNLLQWLRHEAHTIDVLPNKTFAIGRARYGPKPAPGVDPSPITVRTTLVFHRRPHDSTITSLEIYGDFEGIRHRLATVNAAMRRDMRRPASV